MLVAADLGVSVIDGAVGVVSAVLDGTERYFGGLKAYVLSEEGTVIPALMGGVAFGNRFKLLAGYWVSPGRLEWYRERQNSLAWEWVGGGNDFPTATAELGVQWTFGK